MAAKKSAAKSAAKKTSTKKTTKPVEADEVEQNDSSSAPTPKAPPTITNLMMDRAIAAGLPELPEDANEAYTELHGTYVRFISQSPDKWERDKEDLLAKLENLA